MRQTIINNNTLKRVLCIVLLVAHILLALLAGGLMSVGMTNYSPVESLIADIVMVFIPIFVFPAFIIRNTQIVGIKRLHSGYVLLNLLLVFLVGLIPLREVKGPWEILADLGIYLPILALSINLLITNIKEGQ